MNHSSRILDSSRISVIIFAICLALLHPALSLEAHGAREEYDIIYLLSQDLDRVLDYKDELETVFDSAVMRKIKVMGKGDEYALIYDGNDSERTVTRTLIEHGEILSRAGFDEPYATHQQDFQVLFNVSYGLGPNLDPLKKKYRILYGLLGEDVQRDLFVEKTDYGNYTLVYRLRGTPKEAYKVARKHARLLKRQKISTSLTREDNNEIVYGESSLIDDNSVADKAEKAERPAEETTTALPLKISAETPKIVKKTDSSTSTPPVDTPYDYSEVERSIEKYIAQMRRKGTIASDERTGWMVYDLSRDQSIADINANAEFQAASMIKPFVALAFFHKVKEGKLAYGPKSRRKMEAMIQRSNNSATNWVMKQAGGPRNCENILKRYYGHIFKNTVIKEYIPAGGRTYLNSAVPSDYVRFLRALWNKELPYNTELRRLMALPGRDRLYYGTPIPRGTLVYNKTGSTAHLCGDMGILVPKTRNGGRYPYVVVGIIERRSRPKDYGRWMDSRGKVIRAVSTIVYNQMKREHRLR